MNETVFDQRTRNSKNTESMHNTAVWSLTTILLTSSNVRQVMMIVGSGQENGRNLATRVLYRPVNDPRTANDPQIGSQMIPGPEMIPRLYRKWSPERKEYLHRKCRKWVDSRIWTVDLFHPFFFLKWPIAKLNATRSIGSTSKIYSMWTV